MRPALAALAILFIFSACTTDEEDQLSTILRVEEMRLVERTYVASHLASSKDEFAKLLAIHDRLASVNDAATLLTRLQNVQSGLSAKELSSAPEAYLVAHRVELSGTGDPAAALGDISKDFPGTTVFKFQTKDGTWKAQVRIPLCDVEPVSPARTTHPALPEHSLLSFHSNELRGRIAKVQAEYDALGPKLSAADFTDGDRRLNGLKKQVEEELTVTDALKKRSQPPPPEIALFSPNGPLIEGSFERGPKQCVGEGVLRSGVDSKALKIEEATLLDAPTGHVRWERPNKG